MLILSLSDTFNYKLEHHGIDHMHTHCLDRQYLKKHYLAFPSALDFMVQAPYLMFSNWKLNYTF